MSRRRRGFQEPDAGFLRLLTSDSEHLRAYHEKHDVCLEEDDVYLEKDNVYLEKDNVYLEEDDVCLAGATNKSLIRVRRGEVVSLVTATVGASSRQGHGGPVSVGTP